MASNEFVTLIVEYLKVQSEVDIIHDGIMDIHRGIITESQYRNLFGRAWLKIQISMVVISECTTSTEEGEQLKLWILGLGAVVSDIEKELNTYKIIMCSEVVEKVSKMMTIRNEISGVINSIQNIMG